MKKTKKKKMKRIVVTARDIAAATPGDPCGCPIALATTRAFNTPCRYYAGPYIHVGTGPGDSKHYRTPEKCEAFAHAFDADLAVKPFTFTIELA